MVKHKTKLKQWWKKKELGLQKEKKPKVVSENFVLNNQPRTRGGGREELSEVRVDDSETETEVRPSQKIEHRRPHVSNRHPETYRGESREGEHYRPEHERIPREERNRSPQIQQSRSSARAPASKVCKYDNKLTISLQEWKEELKRLE